MAGTGYMLAGSITSNLGFTAKIPLLMKATSNDEKPTQGYDLQEITNISKSSLPNCKSLLNFLLGRLEKKSPYIKFKVLHVMTYLVVNGHSEFRSGLRHNSEMVKQVTSFLGEVDPIHGDGLNMNVREAAKKLELLLFDVNNPEVEVICQSMVAPNQSGRKMEGFGNTVSPQIKRDQSLSDVLKKVKETVPEIMKLNTSSRKSNEAAPPGFQSLNTTHYTPVRLPFDHTAVDCGSLTHDQGKLDVHETRQNDMVGDSHFYEKNLVDDITAEGGARNSPSKEKLREFLKKLSSLDFEVILDLLDDKLKEQSSSVQLKSLCVIEYLLRCDLPNIFSRINDYCGQINVLKTSHEPVVQAKANKVSLTIASAMKLRAQQPPSYETAKELPSVGSTSEGHELTKKDTTELESLFSGMNFSFSSDDVTPVKVDPVTRQPTLIPDLLKTRTTEAMIQNTTEVDRIPASSGTPVDIFDPLVTFGTHGDNNMVTTTRSILDSEQVLNTHSDETEVRSTDSRVTLNTDSIPESLLENSPRNINTIDQLSTNSRHSNIEVRSQNTRETSNTDRNPEIPLLGTPRANTVDLLLTCGTQPPLPAAQGTIPHRSLVPNTSATISRGSSERPTAYGERPTVSGEQPTGYGERRPFPKDMKPEEDGFAFLRKSSKKDAFSFVSDEIAASKTKPK